MAFVHRSLPDHVIDSLTRTLISAQVRTSRIHLKSLDFPKNPTDAPIGAVCLDRLEYRGGGELVLGGLPLPTRCREKDQVTRLGAQHLAALVLKMSEDSTRIDVLWCLEFEFHTRYGQQMPQEALFQKTVLDADKANRSGKEFTWVRPVSKPQFTRRFGPAR